MMQLRLQCCLLVLSLVAAAAQAETEVQPRDRLAKMTRAFSELSYDGTFSYFSGNDLASLRVIHKVVDGQQRERLVHLNGDSREIIRHGDEVLCIVMPGDDLLELESSIPAGPFARAFVRAFDNIDEHYRLVELSRERVADRAAVRIDVVPREADRFAYRLWLDADNALLLRSELVDASGRRLEIFQFTNIVFGDVVDSALLDSPETEGAMVSHLKLGADSSVSASVGSQWRAGWLPGGFEMSSSDIRRAPGQRDGVHTLVYSDGLAAFSVFVEAMPKRSAKDMHMRVGATVSVNKLVVGAAGVEHLVTLVGELPDDTAVRILKSVVPAP